jgi:hypothetical protein
MIPMFEYKIVKFKASGFFGGNVDQKEIENELEKLGKESWSLVSTFTSNEAYGQTKEIVFIFKRVQK